MSGTKFLELTLQESFNEYSSLLSTQDYTNNLPIKDGRIEGSYKAICIIAKVLNLGPVTIFEALENHIYVKKNKTTQQNAPKLSILQRYYFIQNTKLTKEKGTYNWKLTVLVVLLKCK